MWKVYGGPVMWKLFCVVCLVTWSIALLLLIIPSVTNWRLVAGLCIVGAVCGICSLGAMLEEILAKRSNRSATDKEASDAGKR